MVHRGSLLAFAGACLLAAPASAFADLGAQPNVVATTDGDLIAGPRVCSVEALLQITRYRARRLKIRGPHPKPKLTMVRGYSPWGLEHRLRLRPEPAFRRALRSRRRVPVLVKVVVRALNGAKRVIPAEIELSAPRPNRR